MRFADRHDAGRRLARLLEEFASEKPVVAGIPRGGVPVAAEVARWLGAPLEIVLARKIGAPLNPEYGIGAVAEGGARVLSEGAVRRLQIDPRELQELIEHAQRELEDLSGRLRAGRAPMPVRGRTVILVDDGLATGRTARAAVLSLRMRGAARVILAVPVAAMASVAELRESVDGVVCDQMPSELWAIGFWYDSFLPTSEKEVVDLLKELGGGRDVDLPDPGEGA